MTLLAAIHSRWSSTPALTALVPASRVTTGRVRDTDPDKQTASPPPMPYVAVMQTGTERGQRTNASRYPVVQVTFAIWTRQLGDGESIRDAVITAFDNADFTYTDGAALDMRFEGSSASQPERPEAVHWLTTVAFRVLTWRSR